MGQLFKNTASQKIRVFAFATGAHGSLSAGEEVTGDAANITAQTALDNAALGASNDTNPTEVDATNAPGIYEFDPSQAETNGDIIEWYPISSTTGVAVVVIGGNVQTLQPPNFPDLGIETDGHAHSDVKEWRGTAPNTLSAGNVRARNENNNKIAEASVQPDNKPTVDASGHTEAIDTDGTVFNDLSQSEVNTAVDNALDTAIPGSPTADSINERIKAIDDLTQSGGSGDLAAILTDTSSLNDTKIPDTISLANINSEVDTALTDIGLDHLLSASVAGTDITDDSIIAQLVSASATADWDDYDNTTDALQALRDRGDSAWVTATGFSTHGDPDPNGYIANLNGHTAQSGDTFAELPTNFSDLSITATTGLVDLNDKTGFSLSSSGMDSVTLPSGIITATSIAASALDGKGDWLLASDDGSGLTEAGGTGDHLTAIPWNSAWDSEVESEVNDALVAIHLDHLLAATYDPANPPGVSDAFLNELTEDDEGVVRLTSNALEQAPSGSGALTTQDVQQLRYTLNLDDTTDTPSRVGAENQRTFFQNAGSSSSKVVDDVGSSVKGSGADSVTVTVTNSDTGNPIADADVWVTTDSAGSNVVAGTLQTNSNGKATFLLDDGSTYYLFAQKDGVKAIQGKQFTAKKD